MGNPSLARSLRVRPRGKESTMNRWQLVASCLALGGLTLPAAGQDKGPNTVPKYESRTCSEPHPYFAASFSADEKRLLITSDASGVFNAYSVPVEGGEPRPLTDSKTHSIFAVGYFPHDDRILYTQDEGGNELNHLYVRETDGKVRDLTPGKNLKASFAGWADDLKHFYVQTNERDPKFFDLYRYDADGYERNLLFKNTGGFGQMTVSRDGRSVALLKTRTNADNDVYLWDATQPDKEPVKITPHEGDESHSINTLPPDSRSPYYGSNTDSEFDRAWRYDLKTGARKVVVADKWDVAGVGFSWNGRYRTASVNADARTRTTVLDTKSGKPVELPKFPGGGITGV